MNRTILPALLFSAIALAAAVPITRTVYVQLTPTQITRTPYSKAIEIQNLGPNAIFCSHNSNAGELLADGGFITDGGAVSTSNGRKIAAGESWSSDMHYNVKLYCVSATAPQVTTDGGTIINEGW